MPEYAQPPPAGRHGIEITWITRRDQHPVIINQMKYIFIQFLYRDLCKFLFHYSVSLNAR